MTVLVRERLRAAGAGGPEACGGQRTVKEPFIPRLACESTVQR
jgi:hypothetical protein